MFIISSLAFLCPYKVQTYLCYAHNKFTCILAPNVNSMGPGPGPALHHAQGSNIPFGHLPSLRFYILIIII